MRSVVLLSGGLDSTTAAAMARADGREIFALTVSYGQRHGGEVEAARRVAAWLGVARHVEVATDLRAIGGSALTAEIAVPKGGVAPGIPVTYVPARNTLFLAYALALAEVSCADEIVIGVNALDYSGYPDCRPEFIAAFEALARVATKAGVEGRAVRIHAPLLKMTKAEIIRVGLRLGVDYSMTHSCYDPVVTADVVMIPGKGGLPGAIKQIACGRCDACRLRRKGFNEAGACDPIHYAAP